MSERSLYPEPDLYRSPIDLPEGRSGQFAVKHKVHPAGARLPILGLRNAFLTGRRPVNAELVEPLRIHYLEEDDRVWMSDLPEELNQMAEAFHRVPPHGKVLVGGLGLGILAGFLRDHPAVDEVTVVELSQDVINLCAAPGYTVVQGDIADYLKSCPKYNVFYLDTWAGQSEGTWWSEVMPLRRTIMNRWGTRGVKPQVWCWAEDIMLGQIMPALTKGKDHWYYKGLPAMTPVEALQFVRSVGKPSWEKRWGSIIDRNVCTIEAGE